MIVSLMLEVTWSKGLVPNLSNARGCRISSMFDLYESSAQYPFTSVNSVIIQVLARLGSIAHDCHVKYGLSHSIHVY